MTFLRQVPILPRTDESVQPSSLELHSDRAPVDAHLRNMSLCSASFKIKTNSSIPSTSYSMLWINGPKASVMSSMRAYEIQSEVTEM